MNGLATSATRSESDRVGGEDLVFRQRRTVDLGQPGREPDERAPPKELQPPRNPQWVGATCSAKNYPSLPGPDEAYRGFIPPLSSFLRLLGMTIRLVHDDAVGLVAGVDPDHGHWLKSQVDKVMAEALGHERCGVTRKFVAPSFDNAGRCSLHDGDRLVKLMAMAGKPGAGLKYAVAAADAVRAELSAEQVLEQCPGSQLEPHGWIAATESFGPETAGRAGRLLDRSETAIDPGLQGSGRSQRNMDQGRAGS